MLDPNAEYGAAVFIRDSWKQQAARDGSTKVDVYNGKSKAGSGYLVWRNDNYYIALDGSASIAVGSTFRIKTK